MDTSLPQGTLRISLLGSISEEFSQFQEMRLSDISRKFLGPLCHLTRTHLGMSFKAFFLWTELYPLPNLYVEDQTPSTLACDYIWS
jgi:hypothetical protein